MPFTPSEWKEIEDRFKTLNPTIAKKAREQRESSEGDLPILEWLRAETSLALKAIENVGPLGRHSSIIGRAKEAVLRYVDNIDGHNFRYRELQQIPGIGEWAEKIIRRAWTANRPSSP